jgi:uncharacterized membrane protein YphA (DoxX/SURF4 family)
MIGKASFHILRVGTAITFLWIGVLILKSPESWGGYLQPWAMKLLPIPVTQALVATAILDIAVGFFLLLNYATWVAAFFGMLHIASVLVVSGITDITVRDIGLLSGTVALMIESMPFSVKSYFIRKFVIK